MKEIAVVAILFFLVLFSGCSWEVTGSYYPPRTAVNAIGIRKIPLAECPVRDYVVIFSFENEPEQEQRRRCLDLGKEILKRDTGYFTDTVYLGDSYYVYAENHILKISPGRNPQKDAAEFDPPRGIKQIAAFQQRLKDKVFLIVYLGQTDLSNSSTLLIFDEKFRIVYQDHLLGALEIGHAGDKIVVKSENFWYPKNDKRVDINGDWVYLIP